MILKKLLLNKYNFYFILLFLIISICGSVYLYKNKELHNYSYVYKIQLPNLTRLNKVVGIGTTQIPIMTFYQFHNYIKNHNGVLNNCPNFERSVRLSIWEARNEIDWRFEIKYSNPKFIDQCINQIYEAIEESRNSEILKVKNLNEFEAAIFEDSVKEVIDNNDFKKFRDFVKNEAKGLENLSEDNNTSANKSDVDFNEIAELLAGVLKLGTLNINEKLSTPKFSDNFLTGYIYNFLESYKSLRYISSLTEQKLKKFQNSIS